MTTLAADYQRLDLSPDKLNLDYTLTSGQAFRWRLDSGGFWTAPVRNRVIRIRQEGDGFLWQTYPERDDLSLIRDYFRLEDDIDQAYQAISEADERVAVLVDKYRGLRFVRQDPEETMLSFVCSAANSIPRIMVAVDAIAAKFGNPIAEVEGKRHYRFPSAVVLAQADADELSNTAALGFRGLNLSGVARQLAGKDAGWLLSLRNRSYQEARTELMTLQGIGPKIADCVCLFSLDKDEAVPVDTHVRQIAARLYLPDMKAKSVTSSVYDKVAGVFRKHFGRYAGWAQQFLYMEDIRPKVTSSE